VKPYHFYLAFNPLFNEDRQHKTQAHEFHTRLKEKKHKNPDAHMYWGKIQISDYSEPLNVSNFQQVVKANNDLETETHIYITDYHHAWVGKVTEVLHEIKDPENTLGFYESKKVEIWFKITDFDLISNSAGDTMNVLNQIHVENEFYNYKIKEMTPFTSGIRFPMIVQDRSCVRYFKSTYLRVLKEDELLHDQGHEFKLANVVQSFVIPEENFKRIPEHIRTQILHAEILVLQAQAVDRKDRVKLEQAILTYLKCLEMLLNETIIGVLKREEGFRIYVTKDKTAPKFMRSAFDKDKSTLVRLKDCQECFNLSQVKMLLDTPGFFTHTTLDYVFRNKKKFWEYCRLELRSTLKNENLVELRNLLSTQGQIKAHDRELLLVRNILLGVGGRGVFNDIIEAYFEISPAKIKVSAA
jgi:hypothetical protein